MTRVLFTCLLLGAGAVPLPAQQTIGLDQTVRVPSYASGGSDHATVATNPYGDAMIAWHSRLPGGTHQVEAILVTATAADEWTTSSTNHLRVGVPGRGFYPSESCTKPDVVGLDDGSFIVAWSRMNPRDSSVGRLEAVRAEVRDSGGALLSAPLLHRPGFGEGYEVDPVITRGDAGIMPDLVALAGAECAAVYAHETSYAVNAQGDEYREYDLRCTRLDWSSGSRTGPVADGPHVLVSGVPMDNTYYRYYFGGLVLPDVVLDDFGNLVVANEEYWVDGHGGVSAPDQGTIAVRRFTGFGAANPLQMLDETLLQPVNQRVQRRPNLDSSRHDADNSVVIAWVDTEITFQYGDNVVFREVHYPVGGGPVTDQPLFWNSRTGREEAHPVPVRAQGHRMCFGTRSYAVQRPLIASSEEHANMWQVPCPTDWPWRPAAAVYEGTPSTTATWTQYLFLTHEGSATRHGSDTDIYFMVHRL